MTVINVIDGSVVNMIAFNSYDISSNRVYDCGGPIKDSETKRSDKIETGPMFSISISVFEHFWYSNARYFPQ